MICMNNLPDEILIKIFMNLHPNEWFSSLQLVCGKWRELTLLLIKTFNTFSYDSSTSDLIFSTALTNQKYTFDIDHFIADQKMLIMKWLIRYCADHMKNVAFEITDIDDYRVKFVQVFIAHLAVYCRKISKLSLSGSVILILKSLNSWKSTLHNLETLIVQEDSYSDKCEADSTTTNLSYDEQDYIRNTSEFAEYLIRNCRKLRKIHIQFPYVRGPSESCFEHLTNLKLESLTWLLYKPYDANYIEGLLDAISQSSLELSQLNIYSEVKALNRPKLANFAQQLSKMPKLRRLSIGFQLMRRSLINDDFQTDDMVDIVSGSEYFDTVDEAPWTEDFLSNFLNGFDNLEFLCLRNFDFAAAAVVGSSNSADFYLKNCLKKIRGLCFESNYNFDDQFLRRCFQIEAKNLLKFEIYTARLNYPVLAEIVVKFCPNLEYLALSNVDGLSFKQLILSLYSALHNCGVKNDKKALIVDVGTSTSFYLDEVDQLRQIEMCGLSVQKSSRKNMKIERSCDL